eukprot:scaffold35093_cov112-Isochrysis_galbana.AAC.2
MEARRAAVNQGEDARVEMGELSAPSSKPIAAAERTAGVVQRVPVGFGLETAENIVTTMRRALHARIAVAGDAVGAGHDLGHERRAVRWCRLAREQIHKALRRARHDVIKELDDKPPVRYLWIAAHLSANLKVHEHVLGGRIGLLFNADTRSQGIQLALLGGVLLLELLALIQLRLQFPPRIVPDPLLAREVHGTQRSGGGGRKSAPQE